MSTMQVIATGWRAARQASRVRRDQRAGTRTRNRALDAAAEHGLAVLGLGCFVAAAAMIAIPLGLAVAGIAFLVLEMRVGE